MRRFHTIHYLLTYVIVLGSNDRQTNCYAGIEEQKKIRLPIYILYIQSTQSRFIITTTIVQSKYGATYSTSSDVLLLPFLQGVNCQTNYETVRYTSADTVFCGCYSITFCILLYFVCILYQSIRLPSYLIQFINIKNESMHSLIQ